MYNILVSSAGRRVELVQAFQAELGMRIPGAQVFTTDLDPDLSSACQVSDRCFAAPRFNDSYMEFLSDLCLAHGIGLVVPTIDTELLLLSRCRDQFEKAGTFLAVSDEALVAACRDKRATSALFQSLSINTPAIYSRQAIRFPCFCKPYDGSSSIGAAAIMDAKSLTPAMLADENLMFMELVDKSYEEFTVDIYFDQHGELKSMVPRQRLATRAGESSKGVTRRDGLYDYLLPRLSKLAGARGCITMQLFADSPRERFYAIEINPRFGGGYPLAQAAGANFTGWLIDEYLLGREVAFFDSWEPNLMMLRYDAKVLVHDAP
jgi:carbamoyl-phosphate synthase large subunit